MEARLFVYGDCVFRFVVNISYSWILKFRNGNSCVM
jgi:hypothetical protein